MEHYSYLNQDLNIDLCHIHTDTLLLQREIISVEKFNTLYFIIFGNTENFPGSVKNISRASMIMRSINVMWATFQYFTFETESLLTDLAKVFIKTHGIRNSL